MEEQQKFSKPLDFYYVHGGTKGEIATLAHSYAALNIKTACIADFDILQNEQELKKLCSVMNIEFDNIQSDYNAAKSGLDDLPPIADATDICDEIEKILNNVRNANTFEAEHKRKIGSLLRNASKWSEAKKYGIDKLNGGTYQSCQNVIAMCASNGLFIVPKGEMESWWREGPGNKNEWATQVLDKIAEGKPFDDVENFMGSICNFLGAQLKD